MAGLLLVFSSSFSSVASTARLHQTADSRRQTADSRLIEKEEEEEEDSQSIAAVGSLLVARSDFSWWPPRYARKPCKRLQTAADTQQDSDTEDTRIRGQEDKRIKGYRGRDIIEDGVWQLGAGLRAEMSITSPSASAKKAIHKIDIAQVGLVSSSLLLFL